MNTHIFIVLLCATATCSFSAFGQEPSPLPDGLFSSDPVERRVAIAQVEREGNRSALAKLSTIIDEDGDDGVRAAACQAVGTLGNQAHLDLLQRRVNMDKSPEVVQAAQKAIHKIKGIQEVVEPETPVLGTPAVGTAPEETLAPNDGILPEDIIVPTLMDKSPPLITRHVAVGLTSGGGYGLVAVNGRFRIPTPAKYLPSVGIEIGGGWTPPLMFPAMHGMNQDVIGGDNIRWQLFAAAGGVLFYLHRKHYIPLRGGYGIGHGPFGTIGYGYEHLNMEGFFSWGFEAGIMAHSTSDKWAKKVIDPEDLDNLNIWPVVPYVRFSLHFYLI